MSARVTVNLRGETWEALQELGYGFTGDDLGTPDKVVARLIADSDARFVLDALGCATLKEAKDLVDLGRAAAPPSAPREVAPGAREVLVHLNVEVPEGDARTADELADALLAAIEVGSDDDSVGGLKVVCPMAEEI